MVSHRHERYNWNKFLAQAAIIVMNESNRKKYGMTRANMARVVNEVAKMCCKAVTANFFTVVVLLVEPNASIAKPKGYIL